ncbi:MULTISPECIES: hypothetical protein [Pseudarthrobacter]|uniref:Uncharacterized protein n=1 Tax=Pseudarthrobacter niigatensis TaxID=369935 RepID=A0AAJ1WFC2_9MICC|nr:MULTISPECIES: hypothetical protein [Pseudarthrobacter]MDQ0145872.1 hypothetical protein [Pseudarthrobacter niigatensis]MDQ0265726.1 hypothetical protein [Pseudarthrobacter niigatensis]QDG61388.1 hypothetical protein NIBR502771_03090 [Pseudarthrobacter sp. NIBRBAC000502771]QDG90532.1 hypothetical protein NIBR502770_20010 [Pseudarthrobacter sp. NIBRBAC000502770]
MEESSQFHIKPEVADHLAAAMDAPVAPGPAATGAGIPLAGQGGWPDGYGKRQHPKDRNAGHGRMGHEAAVVAVHRTGRPQMPHSS